ncbi:MAG TPA: HAD family hydrolase [Ruminococcus sp.]|nr:HAD family hydrolase [Ruminococcus sp.]
MLKAICSKKDLTQTDYFECIKDIVDSSELESLKLITHHISTTRFQHCLNVSYHNYLICRFLGLDAKSAARAGLLHDLFYYDRKEYNKHKKNFSHSRFHSLVALENASKLTEINEIERDIIENHMFPSTRQLPKHKEAYVIVIVDKYCAVLECILPKIRKYISSKNS